MNSVEIADRKKKELSRTIINFFEKYARESRLEDLEAIDMASLISHLYTRLDGMVDAIEKSKYLDSVDVVFKESGDNIINIIPKGNFLSEYRFDILRTNTLDAYIEYRIRHIDDIVKRTVRAVRNALERAIRQKKSKEQLMKTFEDYLGLNEQQEQAAYNYEQGLIGGSSKVLSYENRNKEKDYLVESAILSGISLSQSKINSLVSQYIRNSKKYRADMIAENELLGVSSLGEFESIIQAGAVGALDVANLKKFWVTQGDERVRANHAAIPVMNPYGVGIFDTFRTPLGALRYPRDELGLAENVINCRCFLIYK